MGCLMLLEIFFIIFSSILTGYVHISSEGSSYFFYQQPSYPRDCQEVYEQCSTSNTSGVYMIKPDGYDVAFEVYCDNEVDSGGWTVFQRRSGEDFLQLRRSFLEYRKGIGFLNGQFWLGHERLSFLTNQKRYQLRIEMTNSVESSFYVTYNLFRISDDWGSYKLTSVGQYGGTADSFISHCPTNTMFGPCTCQGTCTDPEGCYENCTTEETCTCPAGFLLSGSDCVPQEQCSCYDPTFGVIPENGSHYSSNCSEYCACDGGILTCYRNTQCDPNAICQERNNTSKCYCNEGYIGDGRICHRAGPYSDCYEVFTIGLSDGVYTILPSGWTGSPFQVYCNMSHGGGWMVLQRRVDNSLRFYYRWAGCRNGFGRTGPYENIWLGNEKLYYITKQKSYEVRIDVIKEDFVNWHMNYDLFRVNNNEDNNYRLELGNYTGNTGYDFMSDYRGRAFSTPDRDNNGLYNHCGLFYSAGWWYKGCFTANLNGGTIGGDRFALFNRDVKIHHRNLRYSQMKIRPI